MLRSPPLGTSFILFYATGTIPFRLYSAMANQVAGAINANRGLLAYPVVNPLDAVFAQFALGFMTDSWSRSGILAGIALFTDADITLDLAPVAAAFVLAALLGLGVGTLNCVLFGFFPTWKNVWSVLSRPLFLLSGILYLYEGVPTAFQAILWWNPLLHVIGLMRSGFYGSYDADLRLGALRARHRRHAVPGRRLAAAPARELPDRAVSAAARRCGVPLVSVVTPVWNAAATLARGRRLGRGRRASPTGSSSSSTTPRPTARASSPGRSPRRSRASG